MNLFVGFYETDSMYPNWKSVNEIVNFYEFTKSDRSTKKYEQENVFYLPKCYKGYHECPVKERDYSKRIITLSNATIQDISLILTGYIQKPNYCWLRSEFIDAIPYEQRYDGYMFFMDKITRIPFFKDQTELIPILQKYLKIDHNV